MRKLLKVGVLAVFGAIGAIAVAVFVLYQSIDFKAAATDPVPKGRYHLWVCLWTRCGPFKVVDPVDPRFRAGKFHFEDYATNEQLAYVTSHIITRRMERTNVEKLLVTSGGASIVANADGTLVHYIYPNRADIWTGAAFSIGVYYPDRIHVEKVTVHGEELSLQSGDR